jgi:hypothetical protein
VISLHLQPVAYVVCALLLLGDLPTPGPPLVLWTPLLPWTVWRALTTLSSLVLPQSHIPFCSPHVLLVSDSLDLVCDGEVPLIYMSAVHALPGVANNYVNFFLHPAPANAEATLLAVNHDDVPILRLTPHCSGFM